MPDLIIAKLTEMRQGSVAAFPDAASRIGGPFGFRRKVKPVRTRGMTSRTVSDRSADGDFSEKRSAR